MFPTVLIFHLMTHTWVLQDNKYWYLDSDFEMPQDVSNHQCNLNMVHVHGKMVQDRDPNPYGDGTVEFLQKTTCTSWINKDFPERCLSFDRDQWLKIKKTLPTKSMEFCMDQFEFPNRKNSNPWIFVNFNESEELCKQQGKRLCSEDEWTFACEGEEAKPYPYGYDRDQNACVIDRPWLAYHPSGLRPRDQAFVELDRLWQGEPSGSMPRCKSDFGVYDLTGNVDEWTTKVRPEGKYKSILKGGYWSRVRTRCRPSTRSHNENHIFYQQGFRCCSNIK